jgi:transposase InsO family protein
MTPSPPKNSPKRGWPAQRIQRERERNARLHAVEFSHWTTHQGLPSSQAASSLGIPRETLATWQRRWRTDGLRAWPLGRPCHRSDRLTRNAAIDLLHSVGPQIGLPALQAAFPQMARRELLDLQTRYRRLWRKENSRLTCVLHWHHPGAVWAMDHVEPPLPVEDSWPYLLAVRDLASGYQLLWLPVLDQSAHSTIAALTALFEEHGPPLLLKSDNGSGFLAEATRALLHQYHVVPLFSPVYTPSYNGACEAGNGSLKTRTLDQAVRAGRPAHWTADDAEAARRAANELNYPRKLQGATPAQCWNARTRISQEERAAFGRALEDHENALQLEQAKLSNVCLGLPAQAHVDRLAIRRALVDRGFLTLTRRSITPPIPSRKVVKIP